MPEISWGNEKYWKANCNKLGQGIWQWATVMKCNDSEIINVELLSGWNFGKKYVNEVQ